MEELDKLNDKKKDAKAVKITSISSFAVFAAIVGISVYNKYPAATLCSIVGMGINIGALAHVEDAHNKINDKKIEISEELDNIEEKLINNSEDYNQLKKIRKSLDKKKS